MLQNPHTVTHSLWTWVTIFFQTTTVLKEKWTNVFIANFVWGSCVHVTKVSKRRASSDQSNDCSLQKGYITMCVHACAHMCVCLSYTNQIKKYALSWNEIFVSPTTFSTTIQQMVCVLQMVNLFRMLAEVNWRILLVIIENSANGCSQLSHASREMMMCVFESLTFPRNSRFVRGRNYSRGNCEVI